MLPVEGADLMVTVHRQAGPQAIVYLGGNAEDVSLNLPLFRQIYPDTSLYLLHYRGYGGSTGRPSQHLIQQDALALFDYVQAMHDDVAIMGRSLGTAVAIHVSGHRPVSQLLLITPFDSLQDIAAKQFPLVPVRWLLRERYDAGLVAGRITAPTQILVAERDELIPRTSTERLYTRFAPGIATLMVIPDADHNSIAAKAEFVSALRDWQ